MAGRVKNIPLLGSALVKNLSILLEAEPKGVGTVECGGASLAVEDVSQMHAFSSESTFDDDLRSSWAIVVTRVEDVSRMLDCVRPGLQDFAFCWAIAS